MNPKHIFSDERLAGYCVFCGGAPESKDHCPSKVLLDEPLPSNLPVVDACAKCNNSFSLDEQYLACLIECTISGTTDSASVSRPKIARILKENPALTAHLRMSNHVDSTGNLIWDADMTRVKNILIKLARGHIAYELSLPKPKPDEPDQVAIIPLISMSNEQNAEFEAPGNGSMQPWPEIGSRAFIRESKQCVIGRASQWILVQPNRYRYLVNQTDGDAVQIVLSEYLACRVTWG